MDINKPEGIALGGLGLLQGLLTALGAANGGLGAVFVNSQGWATAAVVLILFAALIVLLAFLLSRERQIRQVAVAIGIVFLFIGLFATAYAAIAAPTLQAKPRIAVTVAGDERRTLEAEIKMSGVKRTTTVRVEVNRLKEVTTENGEGGTEHGYKVQSPVLYQAQLGPDASGDVDLPLKIRLPRRGVDDVGIRAWTGRPPPCTGTATATTTSGCVVVRLKGLR